MNAVGVVEVQVMEQVVQTRLHLTTSMATKAQMPRMMTKLTTAVIDCKVVHICRVLRGECSSVGSCFACDGFIDLKKNWKFGMGAARPYIKLQMLCRYILAP